MKKREHYENITGCSGLKGSTIPPSGGATNATGIFGDGNVGTNTNYDTSVYVLVVTSALNMTFLEKILVQVLTMLLISKVF